MSAPIDPASLKRFRCFEGLSDAEAEHAVAHLEPVPLAAEDTLFRQGDPGDAAYLVVSGQVEIRLSVPGQPDRVATRLEAGAIFGEVSLLTNEPRTATVRAPAPAGLLRIQRDALHAAVGRGELWACRLVLGVAQALARRLSAVDQELVTLISQQSERQREEGKQVAELELLRERLFTEWSF